MHLSYVFCARVFVHVIVRRTRTVRASNWYDTMVCPGQVVWYVKSVQYYVLPPWTMHRRWFWPKATTAPLCYCYPASERICMHGSVWWHECEQWHAMHLLTVAAAADTSFFIGPRTYVPAGPEPSSLCGARRVCEAKGELCRSYMGWACTYFRPWFCWPLKSCAPCWKRREIKKKLETHLHSHAESSNDTGVTSQQRECMHACSVHVCVRARVCTKARTVCRRA